MNQIELQQIQEIINKYPTTRKEIDINSIFPNKWNPNTQTDIIFKKLQESIKKFGFIIPILVRELDNDTYEIIDGEHKWKAAKELKYTTIIVDSLGKVEEDEAKLLTINLNNLRGKDDIFKRVEVLKTLNKNQLSFLPFDEKQIEEELKLLDFDFSQFTNIEIKEKEINIFNQILQEALKLEKLLRELHLTSTNIQIKLLCEQYFEWLRTFNKNQ